MGVESLWQKITMASPIERDPSHVDASNAIAPSNAPIAAPKRAPPSMVPVATIEAWVAGFLRAKKSGGWPTIYSVLQCLEPLAPT
jgi:hypothetical protein